MKSYSKFMFLAVFAVLSSCVEMQDVGLYTEAAPPDTQPSINNFYALDIFSDFIGDENWYTEMSQCLQVENGKGYAHNGEAGLKLVWNRQADGCIWTGMGFGWSGWAPKDLSQIIDVAAISFYAKSTSGDLRSLPWALALEDYSNAQAYAGVFPSTIQGGVIKDDSWTEVIIPLSSFDYRENDFDQTIVKQMVIQFESAGEVLVDDFKLIPFEEGKKQSAVLNQVPDDAIQLDAEATEEAWSSNPGITLEGNPIKFCADGQYLNIFAQIRDDSPLQNVQKEDDIWNGDCLEIAISTNPGSDPYRKFLLLSDQHFGIKISNDPIVWNWREKKLIEGALVKIITTEQGYQLEARIPWSSISGPLAPGATYAFEVALDNGDKSGLRLAQYRWTSKYQEGFHTNPSLWGSIFYNPVNE